MGMISSIYGSDRLEILLNTSFAPMLATTKKIVILALGWVFIILGIAGLFLPVLQGILFIFIGLIILSKESKVAHDVLHQLKQKYPGPFQAATNLRQRLVTKLQNWTAGE